MTDNCPCEVQGLLKIHYGSKGHYDVDDLIHQKKQFFPINKIILLFCYDITKKE